MRAARLVSLLVPQPLFTVVGRVGWEYGLWQHTLLRVVESYIKGASLSAFQIFQNFYDVVAERPKQASENKNEQASELREPIKSE